MSEEPASNTTIKFGAGHDRPWFVARGTIEDQRKQICDAFGISLSVSDRESKTLAALAVEASLVAHGLCNAADGIGAKPATHVLPTGDAVTTPADVRRSIAEKAAAQAQPEDHTDDIDALIAGAMSRKALEDIRDAHKAAWTDAHQLQARQRLAELEK